VKRAPLIVAVALLVAGFDVARDDDGDRLGWPDREISVFLEAVPLVHGRVGDLEIDDVEAVAKKAIATWNGVDESRLRLVYGGLVHRPPGFDIYISFGNEGFDQRGDELLAKVDIDAQPDGTLRRVTLEMDLEHLSLVITPKVGGGPSADLQSVLTHMLGRAVGLDLSARRDATMYFMAISSAGRTLSSDDRNAVAWAYPKAAKPAAGLCDACDGNADCSGGFCATFESGRKSHCLRACEVHDDCPVGYSCGSWTAGKACFPNEQHCAPSHAKAPPSGLCASDNGCHNQLFCLASSQDAFCTVGCTGFCGDFGQCRQVGAIDTGGIGLCLRGLSKDPGQPCRAPPECKTMICAPSITGGGRCSARCVDDKSCAAGFKCDRGKPFSFCVKPGGLAVGWPCGSGFDCQSGLCVVASGPFSRVCSKSCKTTTDCPTGTGCTPTTGGSLCLPFGSAQLGSPCATVGACGKQMVCDGAALPGIGTCRYACNPFGDGHECKDGGRCAWVGESSSRLGACRGGSGGGLVGATCDTKLRCRQDLLCAGADGSTGTCARDCDLATGDGCEAGDKCVALDVTDPKSTVPLGVCAKAAGDLVLVQPLDTGVAGSNFAAVSLDLGDKVLPYGSTFAGDQDNEDGEATAGGCAAAARSAGGSKSATGGRSGTVPPVSVFLLLALGAMAIRLRSCRR